MGSWNPDRNSEESEANERENIQTRSEDVVSNLWPAAGKIETMTTCTVGTGFRPTANISHKELGITKEQAKDLNEQFEREFKYWSRTAHHSGDFTFADVTMLNSYSLLTFGEYLTLPVVLEKDPLRRYQFALQDLHPLRLRTPFGMEQQECMTDGIERTRSGIPSYYYIFDSPASESGCMGLSGESFTKRPAKFLHRPNVYHGFMKKLPEQVRGVSPLAPILKLCKQLDKSIDLSILAQHIQASMPVFIESEDPTGYIPPSNVDKGKKKEKKRFFKKLRGGSVHYGNKNEKIKMLDNKYPSANFQMFCDVVLRGIAAASGMPYEIVTKDFSKTNYSSARAALQEAWRIFKRDRRFLFDHFCTPVWRRVIEEAILTGRIQLPEGAKPFMQNIDAWCAVTWVGDAQGYINPMQEVGAKVKALEFGLTSFKDVWSEQGLDIGEMEKQQEAERDLHERFFPKKAQQSFEEKKPVTAKGKKDEDE